MFIANRGKIVKGETVKMFRGRIKEFAVSCASIGEVLNSSVAQGFWS
jgi:hypothetical protein